MSVLHFSTGKISITDAKALYCDSSSGAKIQDIIDITVLPKAFQQDDFKQFRVAKKKITIDPNTGAYIKGSKEDQPLYTYTELIAFGDIPGATNLQFVPEGTSFSVLDFDSDKIKFKDDKAKSIEYQQMQVDFVRQIFNKKQFEGIVELSSSGLGLHAYLEDKEAKAMGIDIAKIKVNLNDAGLLSFELFAGISPIILTGNIIEEAGIDSGMGTLPSNIMGTIKRKYDNASKSPEPTLSSPATASTKKEIVDTDTDTGNIDAITKRFKEIDKKENRFDLGYKDTDNDLSQVDYSMAHMLLKASYGNIDISKLLLHTWMTRYRPDSSKPITAKMIDNKSGRAVDSAYSKVSDEQKEQWKQQAQKEEEGIKPHPFTRASDIPLTVPEWIIKGFIQKGEVSLFFGDPASGKSLVVLDMAAAISNGIPWCNNRTRKLTVLYLAGEGNQGIKRRLIAIQKAKGSNMDNIFISDRPGALIDKESAKEIAEAVKNIDGDIWIIVDTLHRNIGNGDENNSGDFGKIMSNIDKHILPLGATVTFVHHSGHGEKNRSRGSSSIRGSMDSEFQISKNEDSVTMVCTKMKDAAQPAQLSFELNVVDLEIVDEDENPVTAAYLKHNEKTDLEMQIEEFNLTPRQAAVLQFYREYIAENGTWKKGLSGDFLEWLQAIGQATLLEEINQVTDKNRLFNSNIAALQKKGLISQQSTAGTEEDGVEDEE